jgi:hypothetical protein
MSPEPLPLKDFHMPAPIGWWPPAPGWWLAFGLILILTYGGYLLYKRLARPNVVKAAKKILQTLKNSDYHNAKKLAELSILLRRVAISLHSRRGIAGLTGESWLAFLNESVQGTPFTEGIGRHLAIAPYQREALPDDQMEALLSLCEQWLVAQKKHYAAF